MMDPSFSDQRSPNTGVAQSVEHWSPKPGVESSNLSTRASFLTLSRHLSLRVSLFGALVQLVRISPCHGGGHGFESRTHRTNTINLAKIAQLVEHDLAKVGVAGSSPVFRSCPDGGIGRRAGLKHQWSNPSRFDPGSGYNIFSVRIWHFIK